MDLLHLSMLSPPTTRSSAFTHTSFFKGCKTRETLRSCSRLENLGNQFLGLKLRRNIVRPLKSSSSTSGSEDQEDSSDKSKVPFGYTRKDVLLIGLGVTVFGVGLKYGLEFVGVDPLQAGNVVQLVLVLGLTVGWISTYIFRVANKDMTYAKQLRDYEYKVMEKRLESLTEAEVQAMLQQVEEEKARMAKRRRRE